MLENLKLKASDLKCDCNLARFPFESTKDLEPFVGIIGQERAVEALHFGLKMKKPGYNVYVSGLSGTGRTSYTKSLLRKLSEDYESNKKDWVYVYNFKSADEPIALEFNPGSGKEFKKDLQSMVEKLIEDIPKGFSSREFENRSNEIVKRYEKMSKNILDELNEYAKEKGFTFEQTPQGLFSIPLNKEGIPMSDDEYKSLPEEEHLNIRDRSNELSKDVGEYMNRMRSLEERFRDRISELEKKTGYQIVGFYIDELLEKYASFEKTCTYIQDLRDDVVENINKFRNIKQPQAMNPFGMPKDPKKFLARYDVNLFIDNSETKGAPIVNEINPTYYNLTGIIEYKNEMGVLATNFMELKPGAFHRANGGFLILDVRDIFSHPFAWEALKRTLKTNRVTMETLNKQYGYIVTSTLKPQPISLDIKVILIGDFRTYSLLYAYDEDFKKRFKIMADFDTEFARNEDNVMKMAKFVRTHCEKQGLKHFDKSAVQKLVEYSSRLSENKEKLSARFSELVEILYEADAISPKEKEFVERQDIKRAIEARIYRNNKYEEKINEMYTNGSLLLDVEGSKVGQINGLAVMGTGQYRFGKPSRITASSYKGKSGIINIEREVKHSGSIHDKGVLILSGYLGAKYGKEKPLSLSTSITFEQNYSGIDGDSASSTELYVILSSIGDIPIRQDIAVTGSISQKGEIQPIGGVNEKIEGFYDICKLKGLTKTQGVIIPKQNVQNLMLKEEVIESVEKGEFTIYAIDHVDRGLEILMQMPVSEIEDRVIEALKKFDDEDKKKENKEENKEVKEKEKEEEK